MNYRHIYHAGNAPDVFKHLILTFLIDYLHQKDKACFVLDTHAGIGGYDLTAIEALKTGECRSGIYRLLAEPKLPALFDRYLSIVKDYNERHGGSIHEELRYYPGSPKIIRAMLRPQDRLFAVELHPQDYQTLSEAFYRDRQVKLFHQDAYTALKAFLPPKENRGLILIDPPFEVTNEFVLLVKGLQEAVTRFATGTYAIWYPIKNRAQVREFHQMIKQSEIKRVLVTELLSYSEQDATRLNGSGYVIVNPPWTLEATLNEALPILHQVLQQEKGSKWRVEWLSGE